MRSEAAAAVLLFAGASIARAADQRYGPAEFFKLINESKTAYEITMGPVADPVPDDSCERRNPVNQRVEGPDGIKLKLWTAAPEAKVHFDKAEKFYGEKKFKEAGASTPPA
jgi:hypothetical protein